MKLKDVKVGTRVKLKEDERNVCVGTQLKKGMKGTIIQNVDILPYISWDNYTDGHNGNSCEQTLIDLGLPENSVKCETIENLKIIK